MTHVSKLCIDGHGFVISEEKYSYSMIKKFVHASKFTFKVLSAKKAISFVGREKNVSYYFQKVLTPPEMEW